MKSRGAVALAVVALMAAGGEAPAGALIPHTIEDMILLGQEGASRSAVTRQVLLAGDYVYCSGEPGLQTVRVSDPTQLVLADDWTQSSAKMNGSAVKDNVLYVANWSPGEGLLVFDIANPARPTRTRTISTQLHTWDISVFGSLLYLSIGAELDSGINTYDITAASDPQLVGSFTIGDRLIGNVGRFGSYMYVTHKEWLYVYNVSDPANPQLRHSLWFNSLCGEVCVRGNYLYMLGRGDGVAPLRDGGLWVFSLADAEHPQLVEYWSQLEPRDMHFQGNLCVVPASGSGIYTLDVSNPTDIVTLAHWSVSWPGAGQHGGYPICVTGAGNHVFIGTTGGNNPGCDDFTCSHYGARLYSVRIACAAPVIAEVAPDPDTAYAGREYVRQLALTSGDPLPTWSMLQGPAGIQVDSGGRIRAWTPGVESIGLSWSITVRANNCGGTDTESWRIVVRSRADFDGDNDVDQADFGHFQSCYSGMGQVAAPECLDADLEGDTDVDPQDFALFQSCMAGARKRPGC